MKRKIVFVLPNMALGGTEKSLLSLLDALSQEEYNVTLLLFKREGALLDQVPSWVKIAEISDYSELNYDFSISPFKLFPIYIKQKKPIRAFNILIRHLGFRLTKNRCSYYSYVMRDYHFEESFDTAVAYLGPYDFLTAYVVFCIEAKEKIQWIHFDVSKYVFNKETSKSLYKKYNRINVVSEGARESLIGLLPELKEKVFYVKNKISAKRCMEMALMEHGFDDDYSGIRILTIGRLSEEKGQDIIPEIADELKKTGLDFRWYIIGEGELLSKIEKEIIKYGVNDEVKLIGTKTNPYPFYKDADVFVLTSLHEGAPVTIEEAKIFDLPIVSTRYSGVDEQLAGIKKAYIVDRKAEEFTDAIIRIKGEIDSA